MIQLSSILFLGVWVVLYLVAAYIADTRNLAISRYSVLLVSGVASFLFSGVCLVFLAMFAGVPK